MSSPSLFWSSSDPGNFLVNDLIICFFFTALVWGVPERLCFFFFSNNGQGSGSVIKSILASIRIGTVRDILTEIRA